MIGDWRINAGAAGTSARRYGALAVLSPRSRYARELTADDKATAFSPSLDGRASFRGRLRGHRWGRVVRSRILMRLPIPAASGVADGDQSGAVGVRLIPVGSFSSLHT